MSRYGLHSGYFHPVVRQWQSSISCSAGESGPIPTSSLMLPLFIIDDPDGTEPILSMPGVQRMGANAMVKWLEPVVKNGLKSVILFAVTQLEKVKIMAYPKKKICSHLICKRNVRYIYFNDFKI